MFGVILSQQASENRTCSDLRATTRLAFIITGSHVGQ